MNAPGSDIDADIERQLTETFRNHAATIVSTPLYAPAQGSASTVLIPLRATRRQLIAALAIAAVIAAVAVGITVREHNPKHTNPVTAPCVAPVPANFAALVNANRIPAVTGTVVSGSSDGTLLVAGARNRSLTLVDPDGQTTRIWTSSGSDQATVDPQAALNDYAAVFAVGPPQATPTSIEVYRRDERRLETLTTTNPSAPLLSVAPITMNDANYWVTGSANGTQQIDFFGLQDQASTPQSDSTIPVHGVTQLLAVGGILGWVQKDGIQPTQINFYPDSDVPTSVSPATRSATDYTSDRSTLWWLTNSGNHHRLWTWTPGQPTPQQKQLTWRQSNPGLLGSYLTAAEPNTTILDTDTDTTIDLPSSTRLVGIYGNDAILTTAPASGTNTISRLPLADLAFAHC